MRLTKSSRQEALHAVRFAGWVLLTLFVVGLLFYGTAVVLSVVEGSKPLGAVALTLAAVVLILTIQRWGRQVWGLLFLSAFSALLFAASGHLPGRPSVQVSRVEAVAAAGLFGLAGLLAWRYRDSRLSLVDKSALLLLVGSSFAGAMLNSLVVLAVGVGGLGFAWAYDHIHDRRKDSPSATS